MRLFLLGGNGHTGTQIIDLALARSHTVTAFVRSPEKVTRQNSRLTVVRGDPHDADQIARSLVGHDAMLSSLGVRPPLALRPHSVVQECAASTVAAMTRTGVTRLVFGLCRGAVSGQGTSIRLFPPAAQTHHARPRHRGRDCRATSLDWTIVRPPRLTNGLEERYRSARDELPKGATSMSFRAVAAFMLDVVEHHSHVREIIGLGS